MPRPRFWKTLRALRLVAAALALAATTLAFGHAVDLATLLAQHWLDAPTEEEALRLAAVAKINLGPAILAVAARLSLVGAIAAAAILLLTALLGRAYCSILCPLGILQDLLGVLFFWRKNRPQPRLLPLRKGLGVAVWALALIGGWAAALRFLDPFTLFGAIAAGAWLPLAIIAALVLWRRRLFCNSLCPVGALLACGAARAPLGFRFKETCVKCGKCVSVCPTGCLDPKTATFDNGRCIRCLACAAACPVGAIAYGRNPGFRVPGRREALTAGALLAGGAALGAAARLAKPLPAAYGPRFGLLPEAIYPPGAGSRQRFLSKCTDCRLCVTNCMGNVLRPGGKHGAVHLVFDEGMCEHFCKRCSEVCPTGAIKPLDLATKQRTRLGFAVLEPSLCVAFSTANACGACAEHCPTGALRMKPDAEGLLVPTLNHDLCIGCGSCEYPCPIRPVKAIRVFPNPEGVQVLAADPAEIFKPADPTPAAATDDWLI